jgi:hypothetical protein
VVQRAERSPQYCLCAMWTMYSPLRAKNRHLSPHLSMFLDAKVDNFKGRASSDCTTLHYV